MSAEMGSGTSAWTTVYVALLDEGVPVLRPVQARQTGQHTFLLGPALGAASADEEWQYPPGSEVWCGRQSRDGEEILVVERLA